MEPLASNLAWGATLLLYDGLPFYPDGNVLGDFAAQEKMTLFGHLGEVHRCLQQAGLKPMDTHDFVVAAIHRLDRLDPGA